MQSPSKLLVLLLFLEGLSSHYFARYFYRSPANIVSVLSHWFFQKNYIQFHNTAPSCYGKIIKTFQLPTKLKACFLRWFSVISTSLYSSHANSSSPLPKRRWGKTENDGGGKLSSRAAPLGQSPATPVQGKQQLKAGVWTHTPEVLLLIQNQAENATHCYAIFNHWIFLSVVLQSAW